MMLQYDIQEMARKHEDGTWMSGILWPSKRIAHAPRAPQVDLEIWKSMHHT